MGKKEIEPTVLFFPNPVILVTSQGLDSKPNIITIAWTGVVNSRPPMIGIAIQPIRHSHSLIRQAGEFGVNIPNRELLRAINPVAYFSQPADYWSKGERIGIRGFTRGEYLK
jgi:flavin reductase (DIM6/NTAB) family NADH-FMN oxidoreductase RutF